MRIKHKIAFLSAGCAEKDISSQLYRIQKRKKVHCLVVIRCLARFSNSSHILKPIQRQKQKPAAWILWL